MKFPKKVVLDQMRAAMQAVGTVPLTTHPDDEFAPVNIHAPHHEHTTDLISKIIKQIAIRNAIKTK